MNNLTECDHLIDYLDLLEQLDNCMVIFSIKDTAGYWLDQTIQQKLFKIGLNESLVQKLMVGYISLIENKKVIFEKLNTETGAEEFHDKIGDIQYDIISKSFISGNEASIKINGVEYSVNDRGLNIVVINLLNNKIEDTVCFDTHEKSLFCTRVKQHYDIGVIGLWWGSNYGSCLNGYAVYKALTSLGKSVWMINHHYVNARRNSPHHEFVKDIYPSYALSPSMSLEKYDYINNMCDTFLAGSDQIWKWFFTKAYGYEFMLKYIDDSKKKISFGSSFGNEWDSTPKEALPEAIRCMHRFNAISVREPSGAKICQEVYGIKAEVVSEPVFCLSINDYNELIQTATINETEPYILTYILDPTPQKRQAILEYGKLTGLKVLNVLDLDPKVYEKNKEKLDLPNILPQISPQDLMKLYANTEFVITDSFHGTCFAIIFNRKFISITNPDRGAIRFPELLAKYGLSDRLVENPSQIPVNQKYLENIDFTPVNEIIRIDRKKSLDWLKYAVETPKSEMQSIELCAEQEKISSIQMNKMDPSVKEVKKSPKINIAQINKMHIDIRRCQMLAALIRDYGIEHIVISSGSRHAELVRFFENNDCFTTHNIVDERSAGFYALGLAAKIRKPVVVCCTSGTASSNYLSSISEAYYQHIPLIYITVDRYPHLLNQREDQMVPQENMYGSVSLKSVSLIPKDDHYTTGAVRRMICETIMEATRNQPGPVHINLPVVFLNQRPLAKEYYNLDNVHFYKIRRYHLFPDNSAWKSVVNKLNETSRILIVYGQNYPLTSDERKAVEEFSDKFNCVFCVDHLSNLYGKKVVNVFNMMKPNKLTHTIEKELEPEIVITMNGNTVSEIRNFVKKSKNAFHWDVAPDGEAADPYKKLTRIFECTPIQFLKRLNFMAESVQASDSYYQAWKKYEIVNDLQPEIYSQKYATQQILKRMPENALLHLANSNTIRFACAFALKKDITVYCNRGTNGIDGSASSFMGQVALSKEPCYLLIGDLSFFYDMNALWNKNLSGNIRIALFNNSGAGLLRDRGCKAITYKHDATAEGWVKSLGFTYLSSRNMEEFNTNVERFTSDEDTPMFFEIFT